MLGSMFKCQERFVHRCSFITGKFIMLLHKYTQNMHFVHLRNIIFSNSREISSPLAWDGGIIVIVAIVTEKSPMG